MENKTKYAVRAHERADKGFGLLNKNLWLSLMCGLLLALGAIPSSVTADGGEGVIQENHAVPNVEEAFDDLVYWGEWLGFHKGDAEYTEHVCLCVEWGPFPIPLDICMPTCPPIAPTDCDPTRTQHFQGIARSPRTGVPPILFVTRAGGPDSWLNPSEGALWVLQMGSRSTSNEQLGERLRSNRLAHDQETEDTVPPAADKVINWIKFDQDYDGGNLDYYHPGGIQMVGDILAVSLEGPNDLSLPAGKIAFFNTQDPTDLKHLSYLDIELPAGHKAAAVGIIRLPKDHYGVVVATGGSTNTLEFYMSTETDIEDSNNKFEHYDTILKAELQVLANDGYWNFDPEPQSLNFVNEVSGALYLIGARNRDKESPIFPGDNQLYLWQVTGFDEDKKDEPAEVRVVSLLGKRKEVKKWLRSKGTNIELLCYTLFLNQLERQEANFNAGAGAYVSPTGELLYYGTSFWNLGPGEIIRMAELHHKEVSHTGTCGPQFRPNHLGGPYSIPEGSDLTLNGEVFIIEHWVSLYLHAGWDEKAMSERVMIDWADMKKDDYWLFNRLDGDFNDEVSSFRFCGPEGSYLELFDSKPTEDFSELDWDGPWGDAKDGAQGWISCSGTGVVYGTSDFDYLASEAPACQHYGKGSAKDFGDDTTSARFLWTPPTETYGWVLEGVGFLQPIGGGKRAIFHGYKGSSTNTVKLTVWDEEVATQVEVYNVPPTASIDSVEQPNPEFILPVVHTLRFNGSFTDPGWLDTHNATWDFGDGTVVTGTLTEENNQPDSTGNSTAQHTYSAPGNYTVTLNITDDDGGVGTDTTTVIVVSAEEVKHYINDYIQNLPNDAFKKPVNQRKNAFNNKFAGVDDMLDEENYKGAIKKLQNDVRAKADGSVDGNPKNDWITNQEAQEEICTNIDDLVAYLETLL